MGALPDDGTAVTLARTTGRALATAFYAVWLVSALGIVYIGFGQGMGMEQPRSFGDPAIDAAVATVFFGGAAAVLLGRLAYDLGREAHARIAA